MVGSINVKDKKDFGDIDLMYSIEELQKLFNIKEKYPYEKTIKKLEEKIYNVYPNIILRNLIDYGSLSLQYEHKEKIYQIDILLPKTKELGMYIYDNRNTNFSNSKYTNLFRNEILKELTKVVSEEEYVFKEAFGIVKAKEELVDEIVGGRKIKRFKIKELEEIRTKPNQIINYLFNNDLKIEETFTVENIIELLKKDKRKKISYKNILSNVNDNLRKRNYREIKIENIEKFNHNLSHY